MDAALQSSRLRKPEIDIDAEFFSGIPPTGSLQLFCGCQVLE
ncbi:MAG TPA: hypothetical protein VHY91_08320 [Pirellulales bacterium]|nr:hypothetical protein [Pirellulales bacterium]